MTEEERRVSTFHCKRIIRLVKMGVTDIYIAPYESSKSKKNIKKLEGHVIKLEEEIKEKKMHESKEAITSNMFMALSIDEMDVLEGEIASLMNSANILLENTKLKSKMQTMVEHKEVDKRIKNFNLVLKEHKENVIKDIRRGGLDLVQTISTINNENKIRRDKMVAKIKQIQETPLNDDKSSYKDNLILIAEFLVMMIDMFKLDTSPINKLTKIIRSIR